MKKRTNKSNIQLSFGRQWRTGKPGVLHSMGLQRVGHDWATKQQQKEFKKSIKSAKTDHENSRRGEKEDI